MLSGRISASTSVCVQAINHITIQLLLPNSYFIALFLSVHSYLTPIFSTFFLCLPSFYLLFFTPTFSFSLLPVCDLSWHLVESSSRSKGPEGRAQAHHPTSAHTLSIAKLWRVTFKVTHVCSCACVYLCENRCTFICGLTTWLLASFLVPVCLNVLCQGQSTAYTMMLIKSAFSIASPFDLSAV